MSYSGMPTPNEQLPQTFRCARIYIPNSVGDAFFSIVMGQLSEMTKEYYWKEDGTLSPSDAAFLMARAISMIDADGAPCDSGELESDGDCRAYPPDASFITYYPQNPYSDPNLVPSGYLTAPFTEFKNFPLIGWMSQYFPDITEGLTGYLPTDIIVDISSIPSGSWNEPALGVPQISIDVSGNGTAELHMINFPLGGRVIITVDAQPTVGDILGGIIGSAETIVELNRDIVSIPPETNSVSIYEVVIDEESPSAHTIYVTFCPTVDDALIPLNFGGGLRQVVLCGFDEVVMPIVEDVRLNNCVLEKKINGIWIPDGNVNDCVTAITNPMQLEIDNLVTNDASQDVLISANAATLINHGSRIDDLETGAFSLQSQITLNDNELSNHETRITTLEGASGSGSSSSIKVTTYTRDITNFIQDTSGGWIDLSETLYTHQFTMQKALIVIEFRGYSATNHIAEWRIKAGGVESGLVARSESADQVSFQCNDVFELSGLQDVLLQMRTTVNGNVSRFDDNQTIMAFILEYNETAVELDDPVVTFDTGGSPYTLHANNTGVVSSGGNPSNCLLEQSMPDTGVLSVEVDLGVSKQIDGVSLDFLSSDVANTRVVVYIDDVAMQGSVTPTGNNNAWTANAYAPTIFPVNGKVVRLEMFPLSGNTLADCRIDNISIQTT